MKSEILTCSVTPGSLPLRGKATAVGFKASTKSARLMLASPRMLDLDEP